MENEWKRSGSRAWGILVGTRKAIGQGAEVDGLLGWWLAKGWPSLILLLLRRPPTCFHGLGMPKQSLNILASFVIRLLLESCVRELPGGMALHPSRHGPAPASLPPTRVDGC